MQTVICPIDGKPCEESCPDRYHDMPDGGCFLTTAMELGATVVLIDKQEAAPGVTSTESDKVETV